MTKEEFLQELRAELSGLEQKDIDDIIDDQAEFIRDAMSAGRSEEKVLRSICSAKSFADSLKLEYKVKRIDQANSTWESYKEILGSAGVLLALAPLNVFILMGPILVIVTTLFSWIVTSGSIVLIGAVLLVVQFFIGFLVGFNFFQTATLLFASIGILSIGLIGVAIFILLSQLLSLIHI